MHRDTDTNSPAPDRDPASESSALAQSAAEWIARRDRGLPPDQERRMAEWGKADPRHAAELERMDRAWRSLDGIGAVSELDAMADAVLARARRRSARRRYLQGLSVIGAAAAAIAIGFVSWRAIQPEPPAFLDTAHKNYRVLASTAQRMTLTDGTIAELNGASRVEVDFTATERRVRLAEGEVHFIVAKNPARPFFVTAGPVTVQAVGTAFNVRLATEVVEVLVTEGTVKLEKAESVPAPAGTVPPASSGVPAQNSPPEPALVAGQRVLINRAAGITPAAMEVEEVGRTEIKEALGWQSTRLVFNNTPLSEVVEGFNRYNSHQLTIGDPAVRNRALTGVFRADNLEGFVRLLRHSIDVKAELRTPTETVLLPVR